MMQHYMYSTLDIGAYATQSSFAVNFKDLRNTFIVYQLICIYH